MSVSLAWLYLLILFLLQMSDNVHNAIRIHHALATKASDYTKKQHVFRLQTADQSEYLFQTSDSKELLSWVETVNYVCAAFSAPPLEGAVGSQKRFQRPLLPSSPTKLLIVSFRFRPANPTQKACDSNVCTLFHDVMSDNSASN